MFDTDLVSGGSGLTGGAQIVLCIVEVEVGAEGVFAFAG